MSEGKKLRILQVHNYYQISGGEDTAVANEKKLLENHGHTVIQYVRNNSELKKISIIRKIFLPFTTIFNPKTYRDVKRIIREQKIDIVHVHNTLSLISPSVYYAALSYKIPIVQTIHNFRMLCPGATFYRNGHICEDCVSKGLICAVKYGCYRGSKSQTFICVVNTITHRLTGVYSKINYICLTEFNKKKLLAFKQIKSDKVFVKSNFVDVDQHMVVPYEQRENQIIFAGRLDKLKGIDILLIAWKRMGRTAPKLLICGTGPMEAWCKEFVEKNNMDNVELKGFVSNKEVRQFLANSKALILPTQWYEGFPMTIAEAYSVETPVLGSSIGNVGDLIKNGATGWKFKCDDDVDIQQAVQKCVSHQMNIKSETALLYSANSNYNLIMQIYMSVLGWGEKND